jgi:hypothetical protein
MQITAMRLLMSQSLANEKLSIFLKKIYTCLLGSNQRLMGYTCCVFIEFQYQGSLGVGRVLDNEMQEDL